MNRRNFLTTTAGLMALGVAFKANARGLAARDSRGSLHSALATDIPVGPDGARFNGSVLVSVRGKTILRSGYGLADRAFGVPCSPDTAYRIASITKLFTATLVMQLLDEKKLALDQRIATCLPDYKGPGTKVVQIKQLLNHTSGIQNFDKGMTSYAKAARTGMPAYQLPHTPRQLMDDFASGPLVHKPGSTFDYDNGEYVILGQILEAIEKAPYETILERRILQPLNMNSTGMAVQSRIIPKLAPAYFKDDGEPLANDMPVYGQNWYAAGGLYSTVDDLLKFANALYGGKLMSNASLDLLLTPGLDEYGFGQWVSQLAVNGRKHRFAQRPGRIMGANTLLLRMLDDDITVIILGNTNLVDTDHMGFQIARSCLQA